MSVATSNVDLRLVTRAVSLVLVLLFELVAIDGAYSFRDAIVGDDAAWRLVNDAVQTIAYVTLYASAAFLLLWLTQKGGALSDWFAAARDHQWLPWFGFQSVAFCAVLVVLHWMQLGWDAPPWGIFGLWLALSATLVLAAALAIAPAAFWRELIARNTSNIVAALAAGALLYTLIALSRESWRQLSEATLTASHWLLSIFEPTARMNAEARLLGASGFDVVIDAPCSGYEGMGLVFGVLSFYIFAFRRELRFPHALVLLPIGVATIWGLNAVRLALLVAIGAHVSPDLALQGFHSQAGWIFFLLVTISLMYAAHRTPALRGTATPTVVAEPSPAVRLATALLLPIAALMASRIVGSIAGEGANWPAVLAVALPAVVLLAYRRSIGSQLSRITLEPVAMGIAVGAFWIVTHQASPAGYELGRWLEAQPPLAAAAWLVLRIVGFALIVPLAEELAFRGYLHRALSGRHFEKVTPCAFSWLAFIGTSLLFGALHQRWLSGAVAGAVFAITLYRSKTLAGPIAAHVVANAVIAFYAVAAEDWDFL